MVKKIPMRTCVICKNKVPKRELYRIVRKPEGGVIFDPTGKANGRGAYVCAQEKCLESLVNVKRMSSLLETEVTKQELSDAAEEIVKHISKQTTGRVIDVRKKSI